MAARQMVVDEATCKKLPGYDLSRFVANHKHSDILQLESGSCPVLKL